MVIKKTITQIIKHGKSPKVDAFIDPVQFTGQKVSKQTRGEAQANATSAGWLVGLVSVTEVRRYAPHPRRKKKKSCNSRKKCEELCFAYKKKANIKAEKVTLK